MAVVGLQNRVHSQVRWTGGYYLRTYPRGISSHQSRFKALFRPSVYSSQLTCIACPFNQHTLGPESAPSYTTKPRATLYQTDQISLVGASAFNIYGLEIVLVVRKHKVQHLVQHTVLYQDVKICHSVIDNWLDDYIASDLQ